MNLGLKRKCDDFNKHERELNLKCPCKGVDRHIFSVGHVLQVSSFLKCMGYMFYNTEAFIALPSGLKHWMGFPTLYIGPN